MLVTSKFHFFPLFHCSKEQSVSVHHTADKKKVVDFAKDSGKCVYACMKHVKLQQ